MKEQEYIAKSKEAMKKYLLKRFPGKADYELIKKDLEECPVHKIKPVYKHITDYELEPAYIESIDKDIFEHSIFCPECMKASVDILASENKNLIECVLFWNRIVHQYKVWNSILSDKSSDNILIITSPGR